MFETKTAYNSQNDIKIKILISYQEINNNLQLVFIKLRKSGTQKDIGTFIMLEDKNEHAKYDFKNPSFMDFCKFIQHNLDQITTYSNFGFDPIFSKSLKSDANLVTQLRT